MRDKGSQVSRHHTLATAVAQLLQRLDTRGGPILTPQSRGSVCARNTA